LAATPEHETPLAGKGRASVSDVLVFVNMRGARCTVTVEGKKTTDDFDDTVEAWFKEAKTEGARDNRTKRLGGIYSELGLTNPAADKIRYQLLHRAAAAVIEAKRFDTDCAAMVVQSFSPQHQGFEDFAEFLKLFGIDSAKRDTLYETDMPGMPLYFGWASSAGTVATAPVPVKTESQPAQVAEVAAPSTDSAATPIKTQSGFLVDNLVWIVSGVLVLAVGIFFWTRKSKESDATVKTTQSVESAPAQIAEAGKTDSDETTVQNIQNQMNSIFSMVSHLFYMNKDAESRSNGTKFEECIKGKFKSPNFSLTDNRERYPDFVVDFSANGETHRFAVECKWRGKFQPDGNIEFCSGTDLKNYKQYESETKRQTFIALGVQRPADNPKQVYVIPVQKVGVNMIHVKDLKPYRQEGRGDFSYELGDEIPLKLSAG